MSGVVNVHGDAHSISLLGYSLNEYQILSTLPTITSAATSISVYTFQDVLSRGLTYDSSVPVKIEFFTNADCKPADLVATWLPTDTTAKFTVTQLKNADGSTTMTIAMTAAGLAEINATAATAGNVNSGVTTYAGYSNYTMRITYAAIVNGNESVVFGDEGNPNEVVLTWSRTSSQFYDTLVDDAHVYTYGIDLIKTFSDGKDNQELFNNVLFKIYNATDKYYVTAKLNESEGVTLNTQTVDHEALSPYRIERTNDMSKNSRNTGGHIMQSHMNETDIDKILFNMENDTQQKVPQVFDKNHYAIKLFDQLAMLMLESAAQIQDQTHPSVSTFESAYIHRCWDALAVNVHKIEQLLWNICDATWISRSDALCRLTTHISLLANEIQITNTGTATILKCPHLSPLAASPVFLMEDLLLSKLAHTKDLPQYKKAFVSFWHVYPNVDSVLPKDVGNYNYRRTIDILSTFFGFSDSAFCYAMSMDTIFSNTIPEGTYICIEQKKETTDIHEILTNYFLKNPNK